VQDHLREKKNGKMKPDTRDSYLFGQSLPIAASDLERAVKQRIKDLHCKAGGGPICKLLGPALSHQICS